MATICFECGVPFEEVRDDQVFCTDKCRAAYWRARGTAFKHEQKHYNLHKPCANCGHKFYYNSYGNRGGQRVPTYCSKRCRQAAYRTRKSGAEARKGAPQEAPPPPKQHEKVGPQKGAPPPFQTGDFRDALKPPTHWTVDIACKWLDVDRHAPMDTITRRFHSLNKKYHPDINNGVTWPHLKYVNAAYSYMKKLYS